MPDFRIPKKQYSRRGEDGYKSFTIRISDELEERLSDIAYVTHRSRNDVVNLLLEEAIKHVEY